MSERFYTNEFSSSMDSIREALDEALEALTRRGWCSENNCFCVRLCLEEALVNAFEHGNGNNPDGKIRIDILEDGDFCRIRIKDEGHGFDPAALEMPDCEQFGGRGVCLIKEYMDEVHFNAEEGYLEMGYHRDTVCKEGPSDNANESNAIADL